MEIEHIETIKEKKRTAYTLKSDDLIPVYTQGVERFLKDNQSMGDEWVKMAGERLFRFSGKNKEGDVLGSSTDMGVALATFSPEIPLITGQQLLELYSQAKKNENPFGYVYIDFGVQINGEPKTNSAQAKRLLEDFQKRNIKLENGRVPDFAQLRLIADKDAGLSYKLADDVCSEDIALISAYPFEGSIGKNGLFGVYLSGYGNWFADEDVLPGSYDNGRVVGYDAEGAARKKSKKQPDLITDLTQNFIKRF